MPSRPDPSLFVIFGGTGDLSRRKLLPALARHSADGSIGDHHHVLAVARDSRHDDHSFRELARSALTDAGVTPDVSARLCDSRLHYQTIARGQPEDFRALGERIEGLERQHNLPGNRTFYLALPTGALAGTIGGLGDAGLNTSNGWTRVVVEKPFGHDLESARELINAIGQHFSEDQVYRIDHYLGKETVQNLMVFRFGNPIFESLWNREHIESVQITVAEELGVGTRAGYYDKSGALRDMVQNHLTQVLSLVAMEVPSVIGASSVRYEKTKVLQSIAPILPSDVVFGQYSAGEIGGTPARGYLDEADIPADSTTETFVAMKLEIANWRWQGVPFYLRTGKRLPRRMTRIGVRFRNAPVCMFESEGACAVTTDVLLLTLQPDEGFSLHIDVKKPGTATELQRIPLSFKYSDVFDAMPDAYQTLLLDVLEGDQTLFVHSDEVLESWKLYDPLLQSKRAIFPYTAGTYGPTEAAHLRIAEQELFETT